MALSDTSIKVIKIVQALLEDKNIPKEITPAIIIENIDKVIMLNHQWAEEISKSEIIDELIRRYSVWTGIDVFIQNNFGHSPWLSIERKKEWRYWQRYREYEEQNISSDTIDSLDRSTDTTLGLLENPSRESPWTRRGLIVGNIQSGKTAHYIGLICKAADAGYKIIIVLAGLHNNLRTQTQIRLEEGFLGYRTVASTMKGDYIGVGKIDSSIATNCATIRSEKGDFNVKIANHLAITPEQRPWLFVVKKNKTVLRELLKWIQNHVADAPGPLLNLESGIIDGLPIVKKVVTKLPLLMIDDEADNASVDTQELVIDESGTPDLEHQPTTINKLIRRILFSFSRSAYVGYTATPFANIFIHEKAETSHEGLDLFPSSFIINLASSSDYFGPSWYFNADTQQDLGTNRSLIRVVSDFIDKSNTSGWMPNSHHSGHIPIFEGSNSLPLSLIEAIDSFILTCAIRKTRGDGKEHCSMLIHVTRFVAVQQEVLNQVEKHFNKLRQRLQRNQDSFPILARIRFLFERDFIPSFEYLEEQKRIQQPLKMASWAEIESAIYKTIEEIEIKMINGSARDVLNYEENETIGLKTIVIGGDKLSRGLTLEGLCTSYFLRASKMYDTLMQMGRWFGYRPKYFDLCRLYTTTELIEWFGHITEASEELREEFDKMAAIKATPREYGLKVQSHPVLLITSRLKMRTAKDLQISFSGQLLETVSFFNENDNLDKNLQALKHLLESIGDSSKIPSLNVPNFNYEWTGYYWENISYSFIIDFFNAYNTHPEAYKVNSYAIIDFIQKMVTESELVNWNIALIGSYGGKEIKISPNIIIPMMKRSANKNITNRYSIGRLLSPRDEMIGLTAQEWQAALDFTKISYHSDPIRNRGKEIPNQPNGPSIRHIRGFSTSSLNYGHPKNGLLLLYALDPIQADADFSAETPPVIAFGVSFPGSSSGKKISYKVNNVLWEQEYGPAE